ncbi:unnamed protein product, partial [Choristocarpus tenellus]
MNAAGSTIAGHWHEPQRWNRRLATIVVLSVLVLPSKAFAPFSPCSGMKSGRPHPVGNDIYIAGGCRPCCQFHESQTAVTARQVGVASTADEDEETLVGAPGTFTREWTNGEVGKAGEILAVDQTISARACENVDSEDDVVNIDIEAIAAALEGSGEVYGLRLGGAVQGRRVTGASGRGMERGRGEGRDQRVGRGAGRGRDQLHREASVAGSRHAHTIGEERG